LNSAATLDADLALGQHQAAFASSTYTDDGDMERLLERQRQKRQSRLTVPHAKDDSANSVLLFPGQGSQFVGMGASVLDVPLVKDMYDRASQILGYDLLKVSLEGPSGALAKTEICQPAVVVASLAAVERLHQDKPEAVERCVAAAGFSVGEITALIFSGALSFDDGLLLVKARAEAMQYCSETEPSGMISVFFGRNANLGLACEAARKWTLENHGLREPVCHVANFLYAGAKVLAGHDACLTFVEENKADFGIRRVKRLAVSGAFHTPLMQPAAEVLKEAVAKTAVSNPRVPVYSNVEGKVYRRAEHVRRLLPRQVVCQVKWEQSMQTLFKYEKDEWMPTVYECGPGQTLAGILAKCQGKAAKRTITVGV